VQAQTKKVAVARATISTKLAIAVHQYNKQVEVPKEYQAYAKVFSEEDSKQYPPK